MRELSAVERDRMLGDILRGLSRYVRADPATNTVAIRTLASTASELARCLKQDALEAPFQRLAEAEAEIARFAEVEAELAELREAPSEREHTKPHRRRAAAR